MASRTCGAGEDGEICIAGPGVMMGYWQDPEQTASTIVDGWFRSGDIGRRDEDGFIWIVDRTKDLIIRGGFNVYPREVEEVLMRHDAVAQVAVIGLPDEQYGEEVCAVVVRDGDVSEEDVIAYGKAHLAAYKYPRKVIFADALPLGPSGKVLKRELVAQYK